MCAFYNEGSQGSAWETEQRGIRRRFNKESSDYIKLAKGGERREIKKKFAVIQYFHSISNYVKASAKNFGVNVMFHTDFKWGNHIQFQREKKRCQKAHIEKSVLCEEGVVYEIHLPCGFKYLSERPGV